MGARGMSVWRTSRRAAEKSLYVYSLLASQLIRGARPRLTQAVESHAGATRGSQEGTS